MTIGRRARSIEWDARTSGGSRYVADVVLPGTLVARVLRSPHPHARILSLDTAAAARMPGVAAVLAAGDLPDRLYKHEGGRLSDRRPLARDVVRFVGEEVAVVAAETARQAATALSAIRVRYEALPAVTTVAAALADGAPRLHARAVGDQRLARDRARLRRRRGRPPRRPRHGHGALPIRPAGARVHGAERHPRPLGSGRGPARALDVHPVALLRARGGRPDPGSRHGPGHRARGRRGRRVRLQVEDRRPGGARRRARRPHRPARAARPQPRRGVRDHEVPARLRRGADHGDRRGRTADAPRDADPGRQRRLQPLRRLGHGGGGRRRGLVVPHGWRRARPRDARRHEQAPRGPVPRVRASAGRLRDRVADGRAGRRAGARPDRLPDSERAPVGRRDARGVASPLGAPGRMPRGGAGRHRVAREARAGRHGPGRGRGRRHARQRRPHLRARESRRSGHRRPGGRHRAGPVRRGRSGDRPEDGDRAGRRRGAGRRPVPDHGRHDGHGGDALRSRVLVVARDGDGRACGGHGRAVRGAPAPDARRRQAGCPGRGRVAARRIRRGRQRPRPDRGPGDDARRRARRDRVGRGRHGARELRHRRRRHLAGLRLRRPRGGGGGGPGHRAGPRPRCRRRARLRDRDQPHRGGEPDRRRSRHGARGGARRGAALRGRPPGQPGLSPLRAPARRRRAAGPRDPPRARRSAFAVRREGRRRDQHGAGGAGRRQRGRPRGRRPDPRAADHARQGAGSAPRPRRAAAPLSRVAPPEAVVDRLDALGLPAGRSRPLAPVGHARRRCPPRPPASPRSTGRPR